ncbi:MAG: sensor histidine kinase [Hyphomonadaceae bacterium]
MRVLYIDDDAALVRLAEKELARRGMSVKTSTEAAAALKILETEEFDAVVLDHFMPGSDGIETLQAIRARPAPPPVLYVTAAEDGRIAIAALKSGAADYVIKDVAGAFFELLAAAIAQAVEQETLRREKAAAEEAIREARDRAEWLLREVNHRCANSLQLVGSLVSMQATHMKDPAAKQALFETVNRINAVGQVHRRLYSTDDVRTVEMRAYLEGLMDELRAVIASEGRAHAILLEADPVRIPTDRAISLGVVISELITNAFKYAYPAGQTGEVRVALKQISDENVALTVADDGVGWQDEAAQKGSGLGMRIITAMTDSLRGVLERNGEASGVRITLTLPIQPHKTAPESAIGSN